MDPEVQAAIAGITEDAWTPIKYPNAIWDDQQRWDLRRRGRRVPYTAFASKKGQAVTARLIVRRVETSTARPPQGQGELFPAWRYHAVFTDSPFVLLQAEEQHRDHALVEQVFADLDRRTRWRTCPRALPRERRLADLRRHRPQPAARRRVPGRLACAIARGATLRRDLIDVAARTARNGRGRITMHLPESWPREQEWVSLFEAATGPPAAAA